MVARDGAVRPARDGATRSVRAARSARDDTARPVRDAARSVQDSATRSARDGAARSVQDGATRSVRDGAARSVQMVEGLYVRSCEIGTNGTRCCEIGAKCCEIGTRCCGDWCEMVRDSTRCCKVGTRWCEVSTSARSLKAVGEGSRNLHRYTHHTRTAQANTQHPQRLPYKKNGQRFPWGASPCLLYFVCLCCPGTKPWTAVSTDGATTQIWAGRKPSTYENREKRTKSGKM